MPLSEARLIHLRPIRHDHYRKTNVQRVKRGRLYNGYGLQQESFPCAVSVDAVALGTYLTNEQKDKNTDGSVFFSSFHLKGKVGVLQPSRIWVAEVHEIYCAGFSAYLAGA